MESLGWPFWLAAVIFLFTLLAAIELFIGNRSVEALRDTPFVTEANPKRVSIIVAARNEQRNIRSALQLLIELEYSNYELIVVDNRSGWHLLARHVLSIERAEGQQSVNSLRK